MTKADSIGKFLDNCSSVIFLTLCGGLIVTVLSVIMLYSFTIGIPVPVVSGLISFLMLVGVFILNRKL